jgi:hypothetical protein
MKAPCPPRSDLPEERSSDRRGAAPPLPRDVQEHLGRQLRAAYHVEAEKPVFLGDPAIPVMFEAQIGRLEQVERARLGAFEAVQAALSSIDTD